MILDEEKREKLIEYRINQAKETIIDVELLIDKQRFNLAISRAYYGMFYMLLALGLKYGFESSKHQQLIGWFNKTFAKDELIERKYSQIIRDAFKDRSNSDYDAFSLFTIEDATEKLINLKDFISTLELYINT